MPSTPTDLRPDLPSAAELSAMWDRLAILDDQELAPLARRVFEATNFQGRQEVTWEHIGSLVVFAHDLRRFASEWAELADKIEHATLTDLDPVRAEGQVMHVPQYDEHGKPNVVEGKFTGQAYRRYFQPMLEEANASA